ncbi:peptidase S74 [Bacillus thuringiensis serovar nigeriensis]|uniref:phage tail spike protein n=1 Tax=Bacillus cereus group TaxID=86661 RepID=UPI000A3C06E8|nr:phage tail spike protein [Bacillus thuringiensis]MEC3431059.1 phage tail spike protein [Bacillus cereus]MRC99284.1 peptidase S74 [Bacillus thuringiensis]OTX21912.1 peptidase S74 [Bacillus thuringiensis serovar nigeriensis]
MRAPSGTLHVIDFKTDQIVANIQPQNYWDDIRHWEIKNNIDTLEFKVFDNTEHAATLMQQNLVLKEVRDGRIVPYVINNEVEKDSRDRSLTVRTSGAWVQIAKDGYIMPQRIEGKTVNQFMDMALVGTKWKRGKTEYAGFHTMTIDTIIDPLTFLKKIASLFELEIQYRVEVVGSQIVGWYVDMVKKRGRDTCKEVTLGKDLVGVRRIEHSRDVCTALVGFVKGEGDSIITVEKINDGLPYITDSDAYQRWNENGKHKFGFYTPETEEQNMTPKRLLTLMKTEFAKRVNTSVAYDVEAAAIGRVFGLSHELINEGDTIRIKDTGFTPKLYLEARAIAGDESFTDPSQDKYKFGDYREITDPNEEMRKLYNRVLASLGNKANKELLEQLEKLAEEAKGTAEQAQKESQIAKELAEKVQENLKNNTVEIIEAVNPPTTNLKIGKTIWRDISNGKPGILKVWNGKDWEILIPDVELVKKDTLEQVNKDIKFTKEELNKKVEEAQSETNGQFKEVKNSLQEVSQTIKNVQNSQGEIDKTVSEVKQTNEGFTKSIESLIKKDGEITEKLSTVVETAEGTKKTISEMQQTTNNLKKTTTEITEKAGQISEKLEIVEKKFNTDKAGGRNLLLDSNVKYEKTDYLINPYSLTENFVPGEEYTFVIKGSVPQGQKFGIWQNGGSNNVGYATSVYANGITYVTFKAVVTTSGNERKLNLYNFPNNNTKSVVEWVALYKGNKPQDWTPAPENQVTNDEFTKKTTEIEKSVNGVKTTVTNVQNRQSGFEKRMTTVEQTASGLSTTVSNLNNVVSDQGKKITDANSKIQQQATAIEAKVGIKQVEDYIGGFQIPELKNTVTKNKQDLLDKISKKVATESYNTKVTELERLISANAKGISLAAVKTEVYTRIESDGRYADKAYVERQAARIDLTEKAITSTVQKGDIISAINQTAEKITISVSKLAISADTMVQWLTAKGIDTNIIKVNGDKITIDKNGVTIKMLDFLFEDEWGTKTTVIPKRNLIADHDFSSVPKLNIGNPNYQGFGAGYGLPWKVQGNGVVIENNTFIFNYEQMVNAVRVDTYNYPETKVQNGIHPGNTYTLSAHYRTAQINGVRVTAKPRLQVCFVTPLDEVSYKIWHEIYKDFPEPSTFYGDIRRYNFTFTVPNNYNPQEHMIVIKITAANAQVSAGRAVCVSGITLVSGNYACMYNWDRTAAERADGIQPFRRIALGDANTNIGISDDGYTVDFTTNKEFKFFTNIRAVQGVNMGGNQFQGWGHIRFADGNLGPGFYVNTPNGWKFNALG